MNAATNATFATKVAQWPSPVPNSPFVLFTAVGRTYTLNTDTSAVVRTTNTAVGLEFGPRAAPNGRQVRGRAAHGRIPPVVHVDMVC